MAYYLVTATPKADLMAELAARLERGEFLSMRPFGAALTESLSGARRLADGTAIWEEEDYCRPPLAQERAAVLDAYFEDITVETVTEREGWDRIDRLPRLFPDLG